MFLTNVPSFPLARNIYHDQHWSDRSFRGTTSRLILESKYPLDSLFNASIRGRIIRVRIISGPRATTWEVMICLRRERAFPNARETIRFHFTRFCIHRAGISAMLRSIRACVYTLYIYICIHSWR